MKKMFLTLLIAIAQISMLQAQTGKHKRQCRWCLSAGDTASDKPAYIIELDALNGSEKNHTQIPSRLPENAVVFVKVKNVNPLAGNLVIKPTAQNFDFTDGMGFFIKSIPKGGTIQDATKQSLDTLDIKPEMLTLKLGNHHKKLKKLRSPLNTTKEPFDSSRFSMLLDDFRTQLSQLRQFIRLDSVLYKLIQQSKISFVTLKKELNDQLSCFDFDINTDPCMIQAEKETLLSSVLSAYQPIKLQYDSLTKATEVVTPQLKITPDKKNKGVKATIEIVQASSKTIPTTSFDEEVRHITSIITKLKSDSAQNDLAIKSDNITHILQELTKDTSFVVERGPFLVNDSDVFLFQTILVSKKEDTTMNIPPIPIKTFGGIRFNFSTGFAFHFGGLLNESFRLEKRLPVSGADSFYIRKNDQRNQFLPAIAAFMHIYRKCPCDPQFAYTFGLSTNPTDLSTTTFYTGGSLVLTSDRLFILTAGVAGGLADRLVAKYTRDGLYSYADHTGLQDKDLLEKRFRLGFFIGVSYNLSKKK